MIFLSVCTKVIFFLLFLLFGVFSEFTAMVTICSSRHRYVDALDPWPDPWIQCMHDRIPFPLFLLEGEWP